MTFGRQALHDDCQRYLYHHVSLTMTDGNVLDGIIENVNGDNVTVLVGEEVMDRESEYDERQYFGFGRPGYRYRRFRRRNFPLATLATLALLPYIAPPPPIPYYYPPFYAPYYPPYLYY